MERCRFLLCLSVWLCWWGTLGVVGGTAECNCDNDEFSNAFRIVQHDVNLLTVANSELRVRLSDLDERLHDQRVLIAELRSKSDTHDRDSVHFPATSKIDVRDTFDIPYSTKETVDVCSGRQRLPQSCAEATANTRKSGRYTIQDDIAGPKPFWVSCVEDLYGGAWTIIQRRQDGKIDFYRKWAEYKEGFGKIDGEYWIGLDRLHALTTRHAQELLIVMEDFDGVRRYAKYNDFAIGDESEAYVLKVLGNYSGDAGDSLLYHAAHKWSTIDRDNDMDPGNCAEKFKGAWWYAKCHMSNLNGLYLRGAYSQEKYSQGIVWKEFKGFSYALKFSQIMIRPRRS